MRDFKLVEKVGNEICETRIHTGLPCGVSRRGLIMLSWFPVEILNKNFKWAGNWTMQEAFLSVLKRITINHSMVFECVGRLQLTAREKRRERQ